METLRHFINGEYVDGVAGEWMDVVEPATGAVYGELACGFAEDIDRAVAAARAAHPAWSRTSADERGRVLSRIAAGIESSLEELAVAESRDNGKPVFMARTVDMQRAALNFRFFAGAATQFASESHAMEGAAINYTLRQPHGVVGCISPWNLPLYLFTWKVAPALAAGNCVIGKPSELTPLTATLLGRIAADAGLPPGVLNIVHGRGPDVGPPLVEHPEIPVISFTGGTRTGAEIAGRAAPRFKKLSLELGGKNPTIVFDDCAWDETLAAVTKAAFANQGEICLCGSRILVQQTVYERFVEAFVAEASELRPADPQLESTRFGALVSREHMDKVLGYIALAQEEGGRILCGGERVIVGGRCQDGYFVGPTVITDLGPACRTNQEEIFGPVVTIQPFADEAEALALANATSYGLASSIWTGDLGRAHRMAERIDTGLVWINTWMLRDLRVPMGGMKSSGVGREGGWEAMRFFTEPKNVTIAYGAKEA